MQKLNNNKNIFDRRQCLSKEELVSYADGTLTQKEKHQIEKHLLDCELCTEALEGTLLLNSPSKLHAISNDMIKRINREKIIVKKNNKRFSWLAVAAVICVFIISGIYFAFIRNSVNLKSEVADLPTKTLNDKTKAAAPETAEPVKPDEVLNKKSFNSISRETNIKANASAEQEVKKEIPQTIISLKDESAADIQNKRETQLPASSVYNGAIAADQKAIEETAPVISDKSMTDAPTEEETDRFKSTSSDSLKITSSENYSGFKKSEAVSMVAKPAEKSNSLEQQTNLNEVLKDIQKKIDYENFKEALSELKNLSKEFPSDMNVAYFTGLVYYKTNEASKALKYFSDVLNRGDKKLFEDARLYKALSYVKLDDKQNARKILSQIIADNGIYKERAEGILEQIGGN
jgi:tetratricopeptide (TPR) repeat protein